ncbi:MAG: hypothetical protein GVY16_11495 [Planctomycetes bacterium]|jgi:hypothetical protein|nr:hypothetical protein [Phycisphaerae bacterium]NBB96347.1 hypothetical protein [Planctomycetota bacterium]
MGSHNMIMPYHATGRQLTRGLDFTSPAPAESVDAGELGNATLLSGWNDDGVDLSVPEVAVYAKLKETVKTLPSKVRWPEKQILSVTQTKTLRHQNGVEGAALEF